MSHSQELNQLFERNADEWRKSGQQKDVVTSSTIAGIEVAAKVSCADGRTTWTLNGKRTPFSVVYNTFRAL